MPVPLEKKMAGVVPNTARMYIYMIIYVIIHIRSYTDYTYIYIYTEICVYIYICM